MISLLTVALLGLPRAKAPPPEQVKKVASAACVRVADHEGKREGSGVVVGKRAGFLYVLTAAHVVEGSKRIEISVPIGTKGDAKPVGMAELLLKCRSQDFALLRVQSKDDVKPVPIAARQVDQSGPIEWTSIGIGLEGVEVRNEQVIGKKLLRKPDGSTTFVWECRDKPEFGRSGGPLIDTEGQLMGICSGTQNGKGYYCHVDEIVAVLVKRDYAWLCERK